MSCAIVGENALIDLLVRYNSGADLTNDEREILLFALIIESEQRGGIAADGLKACGEETK